MKEPAIISETIEHQIKVLQLLEELGHVWPNKKKPTEIIPLNINNKYKVIYFVDKYKTLSASDLDLLAAYNTEELTYEELFYRFIVADAQKPTEFTPIKKFVKNTYILKRPNNSKDYQPTTKPAMKSQLKTCSLGNF